VSLHFGSSLEAERTVSWTGAQSAALLKDFAGITFMKGSAGKKKSAG
jgi:hypothetical protein